MFAISIAIPPIAIAWAALSILIGVMAIAKRRSFIGWMAASMIFTPFAAVVLFLLPRAEATRKIKPSAMPPPLPARPPLLRRVAGAASESSAAKALAGAASAIASRAEVGQDLARSVKSRFRRDKS